MSDAIVSIGFAVLSAAFALIWWEVRQLRRARHGNAQYLQYLAVCIAILAKAINIQLPPYEEK